MNLRELVETCEICFDPHDTKTLIKEDEDLIEEYNEFESLLNDCTSIKDDNKETSKWIIRFSMNKTEMLDKNITMDDIYFALTTSYNNVNCMYTDYNSDKLIFRIRINKNVSTSKKKKKTYESLDQSNEIYILKNLQD